MQKFDTTTARTAAQTTAGTTAGTAVRTVVEIPAGRIRIVAADRADATVEVLPLDPGKSRDVKAAEQVVVGFADGVLTIRAAEPKDQLFGPTGSVEVTVQVPAGSHLEAHSGCCELSGVGRLGDVVFEGAYRQIALDEAASLRLTAVDGDVVVGRLTGPAQISAARGAIRIAEATRGAVVLTTQLGDISVGAAAGVSASLDAGTGHGRVANSLRNDGPAVLAIRATTSQGDITARSL